MYIAIKFFNTAELILIPFKRTKTALNKTINSEDKLIESIYFQIINIAQIFLYKIKPNFLFTINSAVSPLKLEAFRASKLSFFFYSKQ